jgi:hypothetical protein
MIGRSVGSFANDPLASVIGYRPTSITMSNSDDTRIYTQSAAQPPEAPSSDRRYVLSVIDGHVYAVAFRDEWIPTHAVGPFAGEQLLTEPGDQDWTSPKDIRSWNVRSLVPLCDQERQNMIDGVSRLSKLKAATGRVPMKARSVRQPPRLQEIRDEARRVTIDAAAAAAGSATIAGE